MLLVCFVVLFALRFARRIKASNSSVVASNVVRFGVNVMGLVNDMCVRMVIIVLDIRFV